jgi:hypothetical protein
MMLQALFLGVSSLLCANLSSEDRWRIPGGGEHLQAISTYSWLKKVINYSLTLSFTKKVLSG